MKGSFLLTIGLYISSCGEVKTTDVADIPSGKVSQSGIVSQRNHAVRRVPEWERFPENDWLL